MWDDAFSFTALWDPQQPHRHLLQLRLPDGLCVFHGTRLEVFRSIVQIVASCRHAEALDFSRAGLVDPETRLVLLFASRRGRLPQLLLDFVDPQVVYLLDQGDVFFIVLTLQVPQCELLLVLQAAQLDLLRGIKV